MPSPSAFVRSTKVLSPAGAPTEALGSSEEFLDFQQRLARTAKVSRPVLLIGERGTGKELAAARLHYLSPRWGGPFVKMHCAALSPSLLESELFGHEAGAFTGAARARRGRFETANGGTLFLDEIGLMPGEVQEKILRAVEYGTFERVGASEPVEVDVRLVAATNADLPALADAGRFKRDLLDRLAFEVLFLPPLRGRAGDVMLLARHFAARMASELELGAAPAFAKPALDALLAHDWPGNVRELKNVVERAVHRSAETGGSVSEVCLDPFAAPFALRLEVPPTRGGDMRVPAPPPRDPAADKPALPCDFSAEMDAAERRLVRAALEQAKHHQRRAAELLGLSYDQFRGLFRKYGGEP